MLMQDHLYKDFVSMEKEHAKKTESLKEAAMMAEESLNQEKMKTKRLETLVESLEKGKTPE